MPQIANTKVTNLKLLKAAHEFGELIAGNTANSVTDTVPESDPYMAELLSHGRILFNKFEMGEYCRIPGRILQGRFANNYVDPVIRVDPDNLPEPPANMNEAAMQQVNSITNLAFPNVEETHLSLHNFNEV